MEEITMAEIIKDIAFGLLMVVIIILMLPLLGLVQLTMWAFGVDDFTEK